MKIINYGHACFKVVGQSFSVVFDPYKDNYVPNLKLPKVEADAVLISHNHDDHNALELIQCKNLSHFEVKKILVPHDKSDGSLRGLNFIHILEIDGIKVAHLGDIGTLNINFDELKGADIILCPINGFYTISALEAIQILNQIKPRIFIPMHYFNKDKMTGYEDGNQIDIFTSQLNQNVIYILDELEVNNDTSGVYIFKEARQ